MRAAREGEPTEPGVIEGMPDEVYFSLQHACSVSTLKVVRRLTPHDAREELLLGSKSTPPKDLGTAFHLSNLQPESFEDRIVKGLGIDRRSNANKLEHEAHELRHAGKIILKEPAYNKCLAASEAIQKHPLAMSLLNMEGSMREASALFIDPETGLLCKMRVDNMGRWMGKHNVILDLKTTTCDMSDDALERDIGKFGYDMQAAFYLHGLQTLAPAERRFFFLFVQMDRLTIRVVELTAETLEHGRIKFRGALNRWAKCCEKDEFPGWPGTVTPLGLKPWDQVSDWELDQQLEEAS